MVEGWFPQEGSRRGEASPSSTQGTSSVSWLNLSNSFARVGRLISQGWPDRLLEGKHCIVFFALAQKDGFYGTEFYLSPSGVVDQGVFKTPATFNPDGSVKSYKTTTKLDGADTQKSFFLIANEDMVGQNSLGLGFTGHTGIHTDDDDRTPAPHSLVLPNEILTSGAAQFDVIVGTDNSEYQDLMFGHGGDDLFNAYGGTNYIVGGEGADKFVINNLAQETFIIGDHVNSSADNQRWERDENDNYKTVNDSHSAAVYFNFAWPYVDSVTGEKDPNSYI